VEQLLLQSINASFSWIRQQYRILQPLELLLIKCTKSLHTLSEKHNLYYISHIAKGVLRILTLICKKLAQNQQLTPVSLHFISGAVLTTPGT
jgi:hypothetical protein